jgi:hypothetical protein
MKWEDEVSAKPKLIGKSAGRQIGKSEKRTAANSEWRIAN